MQSQNNKHDRGDNDLGKMDIEGHQTGEAEVGHDDDTDFDDIDVPFVVVDSFATNNVIERVGGGSHKKARSGPGPNGGIGATGQAALNQASLKTADPSSY